MRRLVALLVLAVCALPGAAAADAATRTATVAASAKAARTAKTAVVRHRVATPGTYDVTFTIAAAARDTAVVRIAGGAPRRVALAGRRRARSVKLRLALRRGVMVARVEGRRARPTVRASIRRAAKRKQQTDTAPVPAPAPAPAPAPEPAPAPAPAPATGTDPGVLPSALVWADEFDGPAGVSPSTARWTAETGDGWGNGAEWQTYTSSPQNAGLDGAGNLAITARREPGVGKHGYTSARLTTHEKFSFRYGRLEARMRLPYGKGLWPAFWAMGDDIDTVGWPANGEIDVMESLGDAPSTWYAHVHGPDAAGNDSSWGREVLTPFNLTSDFHTYGIVWSPNSITWTMDGKAYATVTPADLPAGSRWVYDHPFHLLFSLAVGGAWPGYPDQTTVLPSSWLVDWVRVYQ